MDASKYRVGYFPVAEKYNKWIKKDHIEKPPLEKGDAQACLGIP